MSWRLPISEIERRTLARFVIVFALTIMAWATAHDIYLIGVEPRHFTEYHRPLLPLSDHRLLALQYATVATLGPGMVFGALAFSAGRLGSRAPHSLRSAWQRFLPFIVLIEASALLVGAWARARYAAGQSLPYPDWLYPDTTAGIAYSQSVNVTAYLAAATFGGCYLVSLAWIRSRSAKTA
jgi:hypothetical protein